MTALAAQTWSSQFPNIMKNPSILLLALALLVFAPFDKTAAAPDDSYQQNDLLMFFLNPTGTTGNDRVVLFSLGSTWDVFRRAATPTDPTFGTVISLGNINTILTSTYGSDWTGFSSTLFVGAAGNNGSTSGVSTAVANGDYARTVYVTKPRLGAGSVGQANSSTAALNVGNSAGTASAINGANSIAGNTNLVTSNPVNLPDQGNEGASSLVSQNPFGPTGAPATAYGAIGENGSADIERFYTKRRRASNPHVGAPTAAGALTTNPRSAIVAPAMKLPPPPRLTGRALRGVVRATDAE
jgi:hypothetical protein